MFPQVITMIETITTEKKPIKLWLKEIDGDTLTQAKNLANLPFLFHHVAIMADAHVGYGMPIGGVAATEGVVIPNAVGVDIGSGNENRAAGDLGDGIEWHGRGQRGKNELDVIR